MFVFGLLLERGYVRLGGTEEGRDVDAPFHRVFRLKFACSFGRAFISFCLKWREREKFFFFFFVSCVGRYWVIYVCNVVDSC